MAASLGKSEPKQGKSTIPAGSSIQGEDTMDGVSLAGLRGALS